MLSRKLSWKMLRAEGVINALRRATSGSPPQIIRKAEAIAYGNLF
jgi:hypothetical protein